MPACIRECGLPFARVGDMDGQASWSERRDQLVLEHLFLVKAIAARYRLELPPQVDFGDLSQAGVIGLIDAAGKYRPEMDVSFPTYAKHRIKGAIIDSLRRLDCAPRHLRRAHKSVESATDELTVQLQRCPTQTELAAKLGIRLDELQAVLFDVHNAGQISGSMAGSSGTDFEWPDTASNDARPDSLSEREEREKRVQLTLLRLPPNQQKVIHLRYMEDLPMAKIGELLGLSEGRTYRIHKEALDRLAKLLHAAGLGGQGGGAGADWSAGDAEGARAGRFDVKGYHSY